MLQNILLKDIIKLLTDTSEKRVKMHSKMRTVFIILCVLTGLVILSACSGGGTRNVTTDNNRQGLSLEVYNEAGQLDNTLANQYSFKVTPTADGGRRVDIIVNTTGIRVAYVILKYDPTKESPINAEAGNFFKDNPMFSGFLYKYGYVPIAVVTPNWDTKPPVAGTGTIATVTLKNRPFDKSREVSAWDQKDKDNKPIPVVGQGDLSDDATKPSWDKDTGKIVFYEVFTSDCNANGKVDFADFGQIGASYNKMATDPGVEAADANSNGKVDFADFGSVGAKYNQGVNGYVIYRDNNATPTTKEKTYLNGKDYTRTTKGKRGWSKIEITCGGTGDNVYIVPIDTSNTEKPTYGLILTPGGIIKVGSLYITVEDPSKFGAGEDGTATNPFNITKLVEANPGADIVINLKALYKKDPDPDVDISTACTYTISPGFLATFVNNQMTISKDVLMLFGMPKVVAVPNDTTKYGNITSNELYFIYPNLPE